MSLCKKICQLITLSIFTSLLTACSDTSSTPKKQLVHAIEGAYAADISNDGKFSIVSSIHHGLSYWDIENNALLYSWSLKQDSADNLVLAADISDNNSHVVTANREAFALWNTTTGESEGFWQVSESNIRDIKVSNLGNHVLIGKSNGKVVHVTIDTGRRLEFLGHQEKINSIDMLPNGRVAISGSNDFVAYVWDTASGQVIYRFNHPSRVTKVALDPKDATPLLPIAKKPPIFGI